MKALQDMLLQEKNQLQRGNSNYALSLHPGADYFPMTCFIPYILDI